MLKSLYIKNIALIEETYIEFSDGLNILSGETGAGKSIIIDSLAFVLGARADKTLIKSGQNSAFVEGVFCCPKDNVFEQFGFESDDGLFTVARTMSLAGKNEIRINGRIANQAVLKQISAGLVDIFGQNEHTFLLKPENHLNILDGFDSDKQLLQKVKDASEKVEDINSQFKKFGGNDSERERLIDMLSYQINEIELAELAVGEDEELLLQKKKGQSVEKISYACSSALDMLTGQANSLANISSSASYLSQISNLDNEYDSLYQRLNSAKYELEDIAESIDDILANLSFDQYELDRIESRLDKIKLLKRKYGGSIEEILAFCENSKQKLDELQNADELVAKLKKQKQQALNELYDVSLQLSDYRKQVALQIEQKIMSELCDLGMKNTTFKVVFDEIPSKQDFCGCGATGFDNVEFYFSANKGEPAKPLSKIISGGEMSRFMLALKNITAKIEKIPTMVFDEIDTGISGKIAEVVGQKLAKVSHDYQCLVITHLPQIAAMSDEHLLIEKFVEHEKTKTSVKKLDEQGKISEVARLVAGDIGDYGQLHAKDLINWANSYKNSL